MTRAAHRHLDFTHCILNEDPRKFSMSTPLKGSFAYRRVWNLPVVPGVENGDIGNDGAPSSTQVIQDINKFLTSALTIFQHKGIAVEVLGSRHAHCHEVGISKARGGSRTKRPDKVGYAFVHVDAQSSRLDAPSTLVLIYQGMEVKEWT